MKNTQNIINKKEKFYFIGLSIGSATSAESGIAVIDRDLNLVKTDKAYQLSELKLIISNISPAQNAILCIDLPKNIMMLTGKWRIESKQTQIFSLDKNIEDKKSIWKSRFSDRGSELCSYFQEQGMDIYKFNSYYTKNILKITPPYKARSPAGCKFLQNIIGEKLGIKNIPSNLLPLPSLNALIGAYIGWKIWNDQENTGYKQIGEHKNYPIISAI